MFQDLKVKRKSLSRARLSATLWTAAHQAPPSMGLATPEYWSGVPLPSPVSQTNHLIWVWMIVSFIEHRVGEGEEVKYKGR